MNSIKKILVFLFFLSFTSQLHAQTSAAVSGLYSLPFQTREEIENFLRTANIVNDKELGVGVTNPHKLTLDDGKVQSFAVWKSVEDRRLGLSQVAGRSEMDFKDSWKLEVAAYELDKMLGLNMVPVTVERSYKGKKGSLQIWVPNCMTEDDRMQKKLLPPDGKAWLDQTAKMRLFDALVYNIDRTQQNLLISPDWKLYLIDHSRTFKNLDKLHGLSDLQYFSRSFMDAIQKLDKNSVLQHCGKYLMKSEIDNLFKRRDLLVQFYQKMTGEKGDSIIYP